MIHHNSSSDDRAVSEAIGFMLIFTIVIAGIGLVTLYGYPLLLKQQVGADEKIMEKNMIVLQNDIKSLAYKTVPYKETALKIGGGSLTVYNSSYSPASSTFTIKNESGLPAPYYVTSFTPGELRYESVSSQTDISLQNGAVVMRPRIEPGSAMIAEPRWFYDSPTNTLVINLINITSTHIMAKEGIGTIQMVLVSEPEYYKYSEPANTPLDLEFIPDTTSANPQDYSIAWDTYFTNTMGMTRIPPSTPIVYRFPTDTSRPVTLVIKKFNVEIMSI